MNRDFSTNLNDLIKSIEDADVVSILFPAFRKSLVIDTRFTFEDRPLIKVMPMVSSIEERLRSVARLRPNFPRPSDMAVIPWFGYVDSLTNVGVWHVIMERLVDSAQKDSVKELSDVMKQLKKLENEEMAEVIKGNRYETIWSSFPD